MSHFRSSISMVRPAKGCMQMIYNLYLWKTVYGFLARLDAFPAIMAIYQIEVQDWICPLMRPCIRVHNALTQMQMAMISLAMVIGKPLCFMRYLSIKVWSRTDTHLMLLPGM